ncbi:MAG TPA: CPBP family intramembrane glutamic endopeptidase [Methylomirabilota bacterium]|jgi:membrane protease YdiL (CAAX protease family)|nr:CPBP family intramembrane glutamic endopeptidase [Methylomirabilota bacterium]
MNEHDENPDNGTPDHAVNPLPQTPAEIAAPAIQPVAESQPPQVLAGDPMVAAIPAFQAKRILPEDLRVSWSWPHLIIFIFFGFASLMVVQLGFVFYVSANRHLSAVQVQRVFENSPQLLVETNVLWYALLFLFLYVTLAVLRDVPFWRSLGWRKLNANPTAGTASGWMYFFSGCGLAIFVALASYNMKDTEHLPIQEIFKNRSGAMLLMAMAVLVAPLVEETVFRGYLYPLFAKSLGVLPGILITGVLFGLMHGSQLGWTWRLVLLLTLVGVIFTFARARTGTVLASFLLHLGYNSMIALTSVIATRGFQHLPMSP